MSTMDSTAALLRACRDGELDTVKSLMKDGYCVQEKSSNDWEPVNWASFYGHSDIIDFIAREGALEAYNQYSSEVSDLKKDTPLHWACYKGDVNTVWHLLKLGYNPEDTDPYGNSPIHLAASGGHHAVLEILLGNAVELQSRNTYGNTALDLATEEFCRKLLLQTQSQTHCGACKQIFSRSLPASMCQHCHLMLCQEASCSRMVEVLRKGDCVKRTVRRCSSCIDSCTRAEKDLQTILSHKLLQVDRVLKKEDATVAAEPTAPMPGEVEPKDEAAQAEENESAPAESETGKEKEQEAEGSEKANEATSPSEKNEEASESKGDEAEAPTEEATEPHTEETTIVPEAASPEVNASFSDLTLEDMEPLYTAVEELEQAEGNSKLITEAQYQYKRLSALVEVKEEVENLQKQSPIVLRRLIRPLKLAIDRACEAGIEVHQLKFAHTAILAAESECVLYGRRELCDNIACGGEKYVNEMRRLENAIAIAVQRNASSSLIDESSSLLARLTAELDLTVGIREPLIKEDPGKSKETHYTLSNGKVATTLLQAIELRQEQVTAALDKAKAASNVSPVLIEQAEFLQKNLKKDYKDEFKREEERKKLEEEAALKASKKGKKKK